MRLGNIILVLFLFFVNKCFEYWNVIDIRIGGAVEIPEREAQGQKGQKVGQKGQQKSWRQEEEAHSLHMNNQVALKSQHNKQTNKQNKKQSK